MRILHISILFILLGCGLTYAQQRPLLTEDIDTTPPGTVNIAAGSDFFQNAKFPVSGLTGDLTRVGDIRIRTGFASNVEVQVDGVIQNFLAINTKTANPLIQRNVDGNSTNDFSDITTSVKIRLRNETSSLPGLAIKFGFKMPNASEKRGIGTNTTDIFTKLIAQKSFGAEPGKDPKFKVFGNLGIGILTAPLETFSQNDVVLYGLAGIYRVNDSINLVSEVNGSISTRDNSPIGTESQGQFRIGAQVKASGLRFDSAAIFGLTENSPRTGVTFGVTYQSPAVFKPAQ